MIFVIFVVFHPFILLSPKRPHTGDKDPNTHQAHTGYIGSTDNK